ncbi:DUF429 domain-containing protein [Agromyces sp. SYSU T0242]|uniref:DUF429 domain-containing protein n=1 Tax=Agromyces litoreus TaxID=3158561 RepID=UPI0033917FE1
MQRTAGVDLAADTAGTALAVVRWESGGAVLERLEVGATDEAIADAAAAASMTGIDCAFGWPDDFVEFVARHARGERVDQSVDRGLEGRRRLAYRETDRDVQRRTGFRPLSVATDRLGLTAMHCAVLLDAIADRLGEPVARSGSGRVVEVYPAATLRVWQLILPRYKTDAAVRADLLEALVVRAPWLDLGGCGSLMVASDDAFDAVIAAFAAHAYAVGATHAVPRELRARADREGWIALPSGEFEALAALAAV